MRPRVDFGGGHRVLRETSDWGGANGVDSILAQVVWPLNSRAPLAVEGGLSYGTDDAAGPPEVDLEVSEAFLGLRFAILPPEGVTGPRLEPYVAGGLAALTADVDGVGVGDDDSAIGAYVRLGVAWHIHPGFALSLDYRVHHQTDVDVVAGPVQASASSLDATQFSILLGYAF